MEGKELGSSEKGKVIIALELGGGEGSGLDELIIASS